MGLEVRALRVDDVNVVFAGPVVRHELHLDALYEQVCIYPASLLACAKSHTWLEVFALHALLGQRLHGGDRRVQEPAGVLIELSERKVQLPMGIADSDGRHVSVA